VLCHVELLAAVRIIGWLQRRAGSEHGRHRVCGWHSRDLHYGTNADASGAATILDVPQLDAEGVLARARVGSPADAV